MNIFVIASPLIKVPPTDYSGMEREAGILAKGLRLRGHDITLYAKTGSTAPLDCKLVEYEDENDLPSIITSPDTFDVVLDLTHNKRVSWVHPDWKVVNTFQVMSMNHTNGINPVFISHGQKAGKFPNVDGTVIYYGLDLDEYPLYTGVRDDYILYLGQMIPEKRIEWACEVAIQTGHPLKAYGPWWTPPDYAELLRDYERRYPDLISLNNSVGGQEKIELLQHAYALIHPVGAMGWCEAGAICALEALAVGTPVIASDNGCLPEYILSDTTKVAGRQVGAVCSTLQEMVDAVKCRIPTYCFADHCRSRAEDFSMGLMAERYEALAIEVMNGRRWNIK